MDSNFYYSASMNAFYLLELKSDYDTSETWPEDAVPVDAATFDEYSGTPPKGKVRSSEKDGMPRWADEPPLPHDVLVAQAEEIREQLMAEANQKITPLQDAVDLGMATEAEVTSLTTWRTYRVLLSRVDTSTVPDVVWPEMPTV